MKEPQQRKQALKQTNKNKAQNETPTITTTTTS
jgi:hypothetical protein